MSNKEVYLKNITQKTQIFHYATGYSMSIYDDSKKMLKSFTSDKGLLELYTKDKYAFFLEVIEVPVGKGSCRINTFDKYSFILCDLYYDLDFSGFVVLGPIIITDSKMDSYIGSLDDINDITHVQLNQLDEINNLCDILYWTYNATNQPCNKIHNRILFDPYMQEQFFLDSKDYVIDNIGDNLDFELENAYKQITTYVIQREKNGVKNLLNLLLDLSMPTPVTSKAFHVDDLRIKKNIMLYFFSIINYIVIENEINSDFHLFFSSCIITEFEKAVSETTLRVICNELIDSLFDNMEDTLHINNKAVKNAMRYITDNINRRLTLAEVANHVYLDPKYFSRLFVNETGQTFTSYVNQHKLIRAKKLLRYTNKPLNDISLAIGMTSSANFSTFFKKHVGITPNRYRHNKQHF